MSIARGKLLVGSGAMALALGYLTWAGVRSNWVYYVSVDQFAAQASALDGRARIHGVVDPDGLLVDPDRLGARFRLRGQNAWVPVDFHGVVPELFKVGQQVVVEGVRREDGVFAADLMLTKCASRYQAAELADPPMRRTHAPAADTAPGSPP